MAPAAMMPPQDPRCMSDEGLFTKCREGAFSELPLFRILGSLHSPDPIKGTGPGQSTGHEKVGPKLRDVQAIPHPPGIFNSQLLST
jgi:hypothetical protein